MNMNGNGEAANQRWTDKVVPNSKVKLHEKTPAKSEYSNSEQTLHQKSSDAHNPENNLPRNYTHSRTHNHTHKHADKHSRTHRGHTRHRKHHSHHRKHERRHHPEQKEEEEDRGSVASSLRTVESEYQEAYTERSTRERMQLYEENRRQRVERRELDLGHERLAWINAAEGARAGARVRAGDTRKKERQRHRRDRTVSRSHSQSYSNSDGSESDDTDCDDDDRVCSSSCSCSSSDEFVPDDAITLTTSGEDAEKTVDWEKIKRRAKSKMEQKTSARDGQQQDDRHAPAEQHTHTHTPTQANKLNQRPKHPLKSSHNNKTTTSGRSSSDVKRPAASETSPQKASTGRVSSKSGAPPMNQSVPMFVQYGRGNEEGGTYEPGPGNACSTFGQKRTFNVKSSRDVVKTARLAQQRRLQNKENKQRVRENAQKLAEANRIPVLSVKSSGHGASAGNLTDRGQSLSEDQDWLSEYRSCYKSPETYKGIPTVGRRILAK